MTRERGQPFWLGRIFACVGLVLAGCSAGSTAERGAVPTQDRGWSIPSTENR